MACVETPSHSRGNIRLLDRDRYTTHEASCLGSLIGKARADVRWGDVRLDEPRQLTEIFTKTRLDVQVEFDGLYSCKL